MTSSDFSIQVYSSGKLVLRMNNIRSNGNFRAIKRYLDQRINSGRYKSPLTINLYYQGVFQRQIKNYYPGSPF